MAGLKSELFQVTSITGGNDQTLARVSSGEVLGWGGAGSGRITPFYVDICSTRTPRTEPVYIGKPSHYSDISAGYGVSLGVSDQQVCIWGFCQVEISGNEPFTELPTPIKGLSNISKVAAGQFIYAAIDQSGGLYTWGINVDKALGRDSVQINALPALMPGVPTMKDIVLGDNFMIALSQDGRLYG